MRPRHAVSVALTIFCALLGSISPGQAEDSTVFSIGKYREMHEQNRPSLEFLLVAMREAIFFAQHSIDKPVICATPIPIAGAALVDMVDEELQNPTNPDEIPYNESTHAAFVLLTAMKQHDACQ